MSGELFQTVKGKKVDAAIWDDWLGADDQGVVDYATIKEYEFNPDQPRDEQGRWTGDGSGGGATPPSLTPAGNTKLEDLVKDPVVRQKMIDAQAASDAVPRTDTINTPERLALREAVVDTLYGRGALIKGKEAWIVTGAPASGKSGAVSDPLVREKGALLVDADEAKAQLPEFAGGIGAGAVHVESAEIITPALLERAISNGDNIVMPRVGRTYDSLARDVAALKEAGYKVHLSYVHVPDEIAVQRATTRFLQTGRLVSVSYVASVDGHPKNTFDRARKNGIADTYEMYDNSGPIGTTKKVPLT